MAELLANNASTTLNGGIDNSTTTVVVTLATGFPVTGDFRIIVDSEIMLVTGVSGNTFTVTRGVESTGAVSHSNAAVVTHILTAAGLAQFVEDNAPGGASVGEGAIGSRPAAGTSGNLYIPTDGKIIQRDNGVSWDSFGPIYKFTQPPAAAAFTAINADSGVLTDQGGTLLLTRPYVNGHNYGAWYITQTSTWSVTVCLAAVVDTHNSQSSVELGLGFVNVAGGQFSWFGAEVYASNVILRVNYDNNAHTTVAARIQTGFVHNQGGIMPSPLWIRISYGASDRTYEYSHDGVNFQVAYTESKNTNFTPDAAGIIVSTKANVATDTTLGANFLVNIYDWH